MTKSQLGLLGSFLAAGALAMVGCGGSSSSGGSGGKADGGGLGGKGGTAGAGTGGKVGVGGGGGVVVTDGGIDVRPDAGTGGSTDAGVDRTDAGPCVTSFGSDNRVLYSFERGSNTGWSAEGSLASSLGGDAVAGNMCPGELSFSVPFMSYGDPGVDVAYGLGSVSWTGYGKLHAYVKLVTTNYAAVNGIQIFIQSNGYANYTNGAFLHGTDLMDGGWHRLDFDFATSTPTVLLTAVNKFGIQVLVQNAPTEGGIPAAAPVTLYVDDIYLEAAPPDAGNDTPTDVPADTGTDVPADTGTDVAPVDTGTDVPPTDTGTDSSADATAG